MRWLGGFLLVWFALLSAHASDPLRLGDDFRVSELRPYLTQSAQGGQIFSIQNGGSTPLELIIRRPNEPGLMVAFGTRPATRPALRLFASDDREFAAAPGQSNHLPFSVPGGEVQSFFLLGVDAMPILYLWSAEGWSAYEARRQTFHASLLLLLSLLLVVAILAAIYRRSRRAVYAVTMGAGLLVLLVSLWLRDVIPDTPQFTDLVTNRLQIIRIAFALCVAMSVLAHVNLVIRHITNRNYWTRVIIVSDFCLLASAACWGMQLWRPDYAGLMSTELGHIGIAITCASVLLGAVFAPSRRRADSSAAPQASPPS